MFICSRWIRRWCTKTLFFVVSRYSQWKKRPRWNQGTLKITSSHPESQPCDILGWLGSLPSIQWFHVPGNNPKPGYPAVTGCAEYLGSTHHPLQGSPSLSICLLKNISFCWSEIHTRVLVLGFVSTMVIHSARQKFKDKQHLPPHIMSYIWGCYMQNGHYLTPLILFCLTSA